MVKYSVDPELKQINLFSERFYRINGQDIFNVTGWLDAFPKGNGFKQWLMNTKDPDVVRDEAAQLGSEVHKLIEATLTGCTVTWEEGITRLDVWERFLGWCNFWKDLQDDPNKTLGIKKPIQSINIFKDFTEFVIYDLDHNYAGTVDKMIEVVYKDKTKQQIVLDWKSGNNIHDTAYLQVAAYIKAIEKKYELKDLLGFIVQVNPTLNKKGYRIYEVEDIEAEFKIFLATQQIFIRANGEPKPKYRTYPMSVNLQSIKTTEVK